VLGFVRGAPRQGNWAAITFDDGYASVHEYALPALREAAATATVFVVAGSVDGWNEWDQAEGDVPEPILSQAQIAELRAAGVEIGSHGMTHAHLTRLPDARAWTEIADSKSSLEDMMQAPVDFFAYPYGEGDDRIRDMVARAGYRAACSTVGRACMPGDDPFSLPRVNIRRYNYLPMFARKLKRACRAASP
jgi:peptidoglycan/xylan/chitin deacetylase (PgdA/CDA1 family)